jgi:uncharacterized protein (TIGR03437 family)
MALKRGVLLCLAAAFAQPGFGQVDVGSGAPNDTVRQSFISAFFRGLFPSLVKLPPIADVRRLGTTGYVQEFNELNGSGKLALIRATAGEIATVEGEAAIDTFQVWAAMYAYFNTVGVATAGYPTMDTSPCPPVPNNSCTYQLFNRSYALFVYILATDQGQTFYTRDPFYTQWLGAGGVSALGPATSNEQTVTSVSGAGATLQTFTQGAMYNITSGSSAGRLFIVKSPIYTLYLSAGAHAGSLGFPIANEILLADGSRRQQFERGAIDYTPGKDPVFRYPVSTISLSAPTSAIRLNQGEILTVNVRVYAPNGAELTDRTIVWTTSNGRVATVTSSGNTATIKAVGGGTATVTATSEGKTASLTIFVTAPCCAVGEGAPSSVVSQTFQDAVTRNRLNLRLPAADPVRRLGAGYVQEVFDANPSFTIRYLLAKPDNVATVFVVTGELLARYEELGGPLGPLGYPASDATPGGRQMFAGGAMALAGSPVRLVSGAIAAKWAALGYETVLAGPPLSDAVPFSTFMATSGQAQAFQNGTILAAQAGTLAGKAFFVGGLIAARYAALGGPTGRLGMPAGDEYAEGGRRRQEFEGGVIDYAPGDAEARATERPRQPQVTATPSIAVAGSRVRIAVGGFEANRTLRVSLTGQSDFQVPTATGAYSWETFIARNAVSSQVTVRAADTQSSASAETVLTVRALADARLQLAKVSGDGQVGVPGGMLPQPFKVSVRDEYGTPVAGVPVAFLASPGAQIVSASASTDANGEAEAVLRLPLEGVALATAEAARQVVTFSARGAGAALRNFPKFTQALDSPLGGGPATIAQKGALLVAAAAALRYHQDRGDFPAASGLADPALLNQFLTGYCALGGEGDTFCDGFFEVPETQERIVNLWRLGAFAGAAVDVVVHKPEDAAIRDALAQNLPVILALALTSDGAPAGSHFVVAIGAESNGWIQIQDPSPAFARTLLIDYLYGFDAGGHRWKATLTGAASLAPRQTEIPGFLVSSSTGAIEVRSRSALCGTNFEFPLSPPSTGTFRFRYCGGSESLYQLDLAGTGVQRAVLTDLGDPGGRLDLAGGVGVSYSLSRPATAWKAAPLATTLDAAPAVNAATLTPGIAPGSLVFIRGAGLSGGKLELDGQPVTVLATQPFQLTAEVPLDAAPGTHTLQVESPFGTAARAIQLLETAPAIFPTANAVLNQDGTLNSPLAPARRGQAIVVYSTGLGAVDRQGTLARVRTPVTALIAGAEYPVSFAGLAPSLTGVYQVNIALPSAIPPGLDLELRLRQQGVDSNTVPLSIQ